MTDIPEKLKDDLRKGYGLPPYDTAGNPCRSDGYFFNALKRDWPEDVLEAGQQWAATQSRRYTTHKQSFKETSNVRITESVVSLSNKPNWITFVTEDNRLVVLDDDTERAICYMVQFLGETIPDIQGHANLIAAAPDRLEALKDLLAMVDEAMELGHLCYYPPNEPVITKARAALEGD